MAGIVARVSVVKPGAAGITADVAVSLAGAAAIIEIWNNDMAVLVDCSAVSGAKGRWDCTWWAVMVAGANVLVGRVSVNMLRMCVARSTADAAISIAAVTVISVDVAFIDAALAAVVPGVASALWHVSL